VIASTPTTCATATRGARAPRPRGRRGLSLIEVLLALAIFLMSLVAIAQLVDLGTDMEQEGRFQARGTRLALAKLAEFESGATPFTTTDGTFDNDDSSWSWTMTDDVQMQGPPALHLVTVTVSRPLKGRDYKITLSQLMLDPTQTGAAGEATRPDPSASGGTL